MALPAPAAAPPPEIAAFFAKARDKYQARRVSFNNAIIGPPGSGKTFSLRTARKPVLIYQFDPGGAESVDDLIQAGQIFVTEYLEPDANAPVAFRAWERDFAAHQKSGLFDQIGTIALDVTMWSRACQTAILHANGRKFAPGGKSELGHGRGATPYLMEMRDYGVLKTTLSQYLGMLTGISCDFVALMHQKEDWEGEGNEARLVGYVPLITGTLAQEAPLLFDEVYYTLVSRTAAGPKYEWITAPDGKRAARSRLSQTGKLLPKEPQDFKAILKKVGRDTADLPLPNLS